MKNRIGEILSDNKIHLRAGERDQRELALNRRVDEIFYEKETL